MKIHHLLALVLALLVAGTPAAADQHAEAAAPADYSLDKAHSHIGFTARHFGISKVRGEFGAFAAELDVDEESLADSEIELTIQTASIDTGNERRDGHLKSDDFLNAEEYPTITFRSLTLTDQGDGVYEAVGELTIRDTTKKVSFPVEISGPLTDPWGNVRIGISGETTIDRQEFGARFDQTLPGGELVVSDDVEISFSLEALRPVEKESGDDAEEEAGGE